MKRIYYAHSKKIYGSKREREERDFLSKIFNVVCPNRDMGELGRIEPYLKMVESCEYIVCSTYKNHIGKGVYSEIAHGLEKRIPVFCLKKQLSGYKLLEVLRVKEVDAWMSDWSVKFGKVVLGTTELKEN